jgi:hypothetical protein
VRRRSLAAALGLLVLVLGLPAAGAAPAPPPGLGVRLLDAPTARQDDPRARVYVVDQVRPGTRFTRHIEVSNGDREPMDVLVYPTTAAIAGGSFTFGDRGQPGDIPQWVQVSPTTLHLPSGGRAAVTVTVAVPEDAPSGEVYGGIVAERPASPGKGISVALRAGIRVYLSVGPGGEPRSDFVIDSLTAARSRSGQPYVLAQVRNTGGRALDLSGTLKLSDGPGGLRAGPFKADVGTTLGLGQSEPVTVLLDKAIPAGPWKATLDLQSGLVRREATATISFPTTAGAEAVPVAATDVPLYKDKGAVGAVAAALIGLLALLLLLFLLLWRRRRRDALGAGPQNVAA